MLPDGLEALDIDKLIDERPDVILNIVDTTNLERNLYLTTQLTEIGIPVVIALNMMDIVRNRGDRINVEELSREMGCGSWRRPPSAATASGRRPRLPSPRKRWPISSRISGRPKRSWMNDVFGGEWLEGGIRQQCAPPSCREKKPGRLVRACPVL